MDKDVSSKLEKLEDNQAKLTVTVAAAEVDRRIKAQYKEASRKYRFPGFRSGKAPRGVIDNAFGGKEAVLTEATDTLLNDLYPQALTDQDVHPLGDPKFEEAGIVADGAEYSFCATFEVKPEFELSSYDPVEIELPPEEATQQDIDLQINALKEYYYSFKEITGRTVKDEDYVVLAMRAEQAGEPVEALCSEERIYQLGQGHFSEDFDKNLKRMKIDATKKFSIEEDGTATDYEVTIKGIREKEYPALDDEFAKLCGFESLDDLNERLSTSITEQKRMKMPHIKEQEACYALAERLQGEAPESVVKATQGELAQQIFTDLQRQGVTLDVYMQQRGITPEQFQKDLEQQSGDSARQSLALDALARHLGLEVTDDEIMEEFVNSGMEKPKELKEEWEREGRIPQLRESMLRSKASDKLVADAIVTIKQPEAAEEKTKKPAAKKAAAKKTADKKPAAKKASAKDTDEKKPAAKKTADNATDEK